MILSTHGIVGSQITQFVGLLDLYPSAAAAYSLRKLRAAYTGSAIRVRNSSNSEADIGFVNNVLDTASLLTHCGIGDGFVTTWYDQSGNGRNATQGIGIYQPKIVSSGSVILENSKPCLDWDGSLIYLRTGSFSPTIAQPVSYFITSRVDSIANNALIDGISNGDGLFYRSTTSNMNYFLGATLSDSSMPSSQLLFSILADTTASEIYNNSSLELSGNLGNLNIGGFTFGNLGTGFETNSYQLKGSFQEFVFYPSNQSSNRTGIETNINDFYSIY